MRKDVEEHNNTFNNHHTQLLLQKYLVTSNELVGTKQELFETKEDLAETKQEFVKTKEEFVKTKEELAETKEELVKTKEEFAETKQELVANTVGIIAKELIETKEELKRTQQSMKKITDDELCATKQNLNKLQEEFETSKKTINSLEQKLIKNNADKANMKERMVKQFHTCFCAIEKSVNTIAENVVLKQSESPLLAILNASNYKQYVENLRIEPIELNGHTYKFTEFNKMLNTPLEERPLRLSYQERLQIVLESMKLGDIYAESERVCYFKLQFNHPIDSFFVSTGNVKELQRECRSNVLFGNDTLSLFKFKNNKYELYHQIKGYFDPSKSSMYIYDKIIEDEKLRISYQYCHTNIDFTKYKCATNEILFQLVKE